MRVTTLLGLLFAVAAVIMGIVGMHAGWFSSPSTGLTPNSEPLLKISAADIAGVVIARPGAPPLRLVRLPDQWRITSPIWAPADPQQVDLTVSAITELRTARLYGSDDPSRPPDDSTGLAEPRMTVTVLDARGESHEIRIGARPPLIRQTYAQLDRTDDIRLIGPDPTTTLSRPFNLYRHKTLLEFQPDRLTRLIVGGRVNYELTRRGDGWTLSADGAENIPADPAKAAALIDRLDKLEITGVTPNEATDLTAFGLQPPQLVFILMLQRIPGEIPSGPPDDPSGPDAIEVAFGTLDGGVFAMLEGDKRLLIIRPADFESLAVPIDELRDRRALPIAPDRITAITVHAENRVLSLIKTAKEWTIPAAAEVAPDAEHLVDVLTRLTAQSFITHYTSLAGFGLEHPSTRYDVTDADGNVTALLIGDVDDDGKAAYVKCARRKTVMKVRGGELIALGGDIRAWPGWVGAAEDD